MEELGMQTQSWQLQALAHKNLILKVKKKTGASHVGHIKGIVREDGVKINCIWIKSDKGEIKYGGEKDFADFTAQDYDNAATQYLTHIREL